MKLTFLCLCASLSLVLGLFATDSLSQQVKPTPSVTKPKGNPLDKGDFKIGFSPQNKAQNPRKKDMNADDKAALQGIADALNSFIALPKDIWINMDTCGEPNAFYSHETAEIIFCYELEQQFENEFKTIEKNQAKLDAMVEDTLLQTLFHELGHCLIDVWDLPATGREEDAVDQLAVIIMLDGTAEGQMSVIHAALEFDIASKDDDPNDMAFWDEHSFNKTRFYDMLCLVYGSNPTKNAGLIGPNKLPENRAGMCETEYKRAEHAWLKLIAPYILN